MIKNNLFYLNHIIENLNDIDDFMKNVTREKFNKNREKQKAVIKSIEAIGEAIRELPATDRKMLNKFLSSYCGGYHQDFWEEEGTCYLLDRRCLGRNGVSSVGLKTASDRIKRIFQETYN